MVKSTAPPTFGSTPARGERILVLRQHWMNLILNGEKTLEIRRKRLKQGDVWLGYRQEIVGKAYLGEAIFINSTEAWNARRSQHRVETRGLPYKKTWALPLAKVFRLPKTVPYLHPRGAIGIVRFIPSDRAK